MNGFVKLFQSILGSSIWYGSNEDLRVWITILVLKDRYHRVRISIPGLANIARVTVDECRGALGRFEQPDENSTSKEWDGRKIEPLPEGGWLVLNGERYARMLSYEERKEYNRNKQAEYRRRKKGIIEEGKKDGARQAIRDGLNGS